jgi:glycerol kinase
VGLERSTTIGHVARAAVESMAYQSRDVLDAMERDAGIRLAQLKVDGGAAANNDLLQFQADLLGVPVRRPVVAETTALGAAYLAGLAEGVWGSLEEVAATWQQEAAFVPAADREAADTAHQAWLRAVERSRRWAEE